MAKPTQVERVEIKPPDFGRGLFRIVGTVPYVQNQFTAKAKEQIRAAHESGSKSKKGKAREPKNFDACYVAAQHLSREGWHGIPAAAFRNAMVSACRLVGFAMTRAKLSLFADADGFDAGDYTPLIRITKGAPEHVEHYVRNETGVVDLRARAMWREGWEANLRLSWDNGQFSLSDVSNLLLRAGSQVGIGEGRPDSPNSCGMGWGLFTIGEPLK